MAETSSGAVGARKDDSGKLRYDLIPAYPLEELARVYTIGASKYDPNNWRKGFKWTRVAGALLRHFYAWYRGEKVDPENGQLHMSSVAWCAFTLMEFERKGSGEDDRADKDS